MWSFISLIHRSPTPSLSLSRLSSTIERLPCPSGASQPRGAHFVRPCPQSDEPYLAYLLTLAGITRLRLTNTNTNNTIPSTNNTATDTSTSDISSGYPFTTRHPITAPDIIQDFKAATIRLVERFAHDTLQSAHKRESWARIVHVVDETEPG